MMTAACIRRASRRGVFRGAALLLGLSLTFGASGAARAGSLDEIRARGVLVVGAKADYRPFGFRDEAGMIVGFEPDLAAEIAKARSS